MPDSTSPQPPDPVLQPELWRVWIAGYEAGYAAGIDRGRAEVVASILPAAQELASTHPSRGTAHEDLVKRRAAAAAAAPSRSAEEIRAHATRSWGLPATASTAARQPRPSAQKSVEADQGRADVPEHHRACRRPAPTLPSTRGIGR